MLSSTFAIGAAAVAFVVTIHFGVFSSELVFDALAAYLSDRTARWPFAAIDFIANFILLYAPLYWLGRRIARRSMPGSLPHASRGVERVLSDDPITDDSSDEFETAPFANELAKSLLLGPNTPGIVVSLEGSWGAGKSSVLAHLRRVFSISAPKPLVLEFNPWLIAGRDAIVRAFIRQLASALQKETQGDAAQRLLSFANAIDQVAGSSVVAGPIRLLSDKIARRLGKLPVGDLHEYRSELDKAIRRIEKPIVVIIDDVDRLQREDLLAVFQLVKAVANFPRVAYLILLDPKVVDSVLEAEPDVPSGPKFREKIVQVGVTIPRISYVRRAKFFDSRFSDRISQWAVPLGVEESRLLSEARSIVLATLRTPRELKRLINRTFLMFDRIRGEVFLGDVLVFEALRLHHPVVAGALVSEPELLGFDLDVAPWKPVEAYYEDVPTEEEVRNEKPSRLSALLAMEPVSSHHLRSMLSFLFGPCFGEQDEIHEEAVRLRRLSRKENLEKFLSLGLVTPFASSTNAELFLTDSGIRISQLNEALQLGAFQDWMKHVRDHLPAELPAGALAAILSDVYAALGSVATGGGEGEAAAGFAFDALKRATSEAERIQVLRELLMNKRTAVIAERLLTFVLDDAGVWKRGKFLGAASREPTRGEIAWQNVEALDLLARDWVATMELLGVNAVLSSSENVLSALFRWAQLEEPPFQGVRLHLSSVLTSNEQARIQFANLFPRNMSFAGVDQFFDNDAVEAMRSWISKRVAATDAEKRFKVWIEGGLSGDPDDFGLFEDQ